MKIAFATPKLGAFGGVEEFVRQIARGLKARGHEVHLLYGERTGRSEDETISSFNAVHPINELDACEGSALGLSQVMHELQADMLFLHKAESLVTCLPTDREYRAIAMVHDHDLCCPRRHKYFAHNGQVCNRAAGWRCWLDGAFLERDRESKFGVRWNSLRQHSRRLQAHRGLDGLVVASHAMAEELRINGVDDHKIHLAIPGSDARPHKSGSVPSESNRLLYVGQLIRGKGVDLLLEALQQVKSSFKLDIVGDGNARQTLERKAQQLGLNEHVQFHGWQAHEKLGEYYTSARCSIVPSRWPEPFGLVGLEAMRYGRPVIGFEVGGIPDWLAHKKTGLLVPQQSVQALSRAIECLLNDDALSDEMGRAATARFVDEFQSEAAILRLVHALNLEPDCQEDAA